MRFHRFILFLMMTITSVCRGAITNSFGIYLTAKPVDARIMAGGKGDWSSVRLAGSPIISDADILVYDFTNHLMTLKPEAFRHIPRPDASGIPFVVVANGERIYLGVFMTGLSSMSIAVPSIIVDAHNLDTNLPPNTLRIDRVYFAPYSTTDPDPRLDDRIKQSLTSVHKLK